MTPKLILVIKGGVLQSIISSVDIKYVLVDWDNINGGDEFPTEIDYEPDVLAEDIESYLATLNEEEG